MANRSIHKGLSDTALKNAKPSNKDYTMPDGNGLQLLVKPNGSKIWEVRFTLHSRPRKTTIGKYPVVSLKNARTKCEEYKSLAEQGIDPIEQKRVLKLQRSLEDKGQFHLVVKEWNESLTCSEKTKKKLYRMFERDIFPYFCKYDKQHNIVSSRHIKTIKHNELLNAIDEKALTAQETASRIFRNSVRLWKYAIAHDYTEILITLKIDKGLIPNPKAEHIAKITNAEILKELLTEITNYHGDLLTRSLLLFVIRVPLRAQNLCRLRWSQVDMEKGIITIPRAEMKLNDVNLPDFVIMLPTQVVTLLKEVHEITGWGKWVFHGSRNMNTHIGLETGNNALRAMGFTDKKKKRKQTLHSFRGTFRSLAETHREEHNAPFEVMERSLDHHEKNPVVRAYSHEADYSKSIGELLQWWSDYLDNLFDVKTK